MVQDKQPKRLQLIFVVKIKSLQISIKIGATTKIITSRVNWGTGVVATSIASSAEASEPQSTSLKLSKDYSNMD